MTEDVRAAIRAERSEQADLLAGLTPQQWEAPTLCAGWRPREVIAHTTLAYRTSMPKVVWEIVRAGGRFNRASDRMARRDAEALTPAQLVACLRDNVDHPWQPPGGGPEGALSHDVIHGLDVTVGLGLDRSPPPERVRLVLAGMRPKNLSYFGVDLTGVRLEATDLDWSIGDGEPVRGRAADLLLAACGRKVPAGRLEGARANRFAGKTD
jgi:uncharacterized protein (TIGR03083 family)